MSTKEGNANRRADEGNVNLFVSDRHLDMVINERRFLMMPFDFSFSLHWTFRKRGPGIIDRVCERLWVATGAPVAADYLAFKLMCVVHATRDGLRNLLHRVRESKARD